MHWESVRMKLNVAFSLAVFRNASENQPENHQNRPLLADSVFCALGGRREPEKKKIGRTAQTGPRGQKEVATGR